MSHISRESGPVFFRALSWNAVFSIACGLIMVLAPSSVAAWLGWGHSAVIVGIGVFLVLFAARLFLAVRSGQLFRWEAQAIVAGDAGWVVGSVLLVALFHTRFSTTGVLLVLGTALVVGCLAAVQMAGMRRSSPVT